MEEYKGIYYNDNTKQQYYEGGAHFKYIELYRSLEELAIKINSKKLQKTIKHVRILILILLNLIFRLIT